METFGVKLNAFGIMLWLQTYEDHEVQCGGLDGYGPYRFIHLNSWHSTVRSYVIDIGVTLLEEACHFGVGLRHLIYILKQYPV